MPTVCDLIKVATPKTDGISILPTLLGEPNRQAQHAYLYWEFKEKGGRRAVLQDGWKGVALDTNKMGLDSFELYDLSKDPGEMDNIASAHPDRVEAVINVSVPYMPWPMQPTELFKAIYADRFFYMLYFQKADIVEQELEADLDLTLRTILWGGSGEMLQTPTEPGDLPPLEGTGLLETWSSSTPIPVGLPEWLTPADHAHYIEQFTTSGFFGPIGWYRNLDADWELTRDLPAPSMP